MSDLPTPITREEQFLNGIAQGDTSNLPTPVGREEKYLDYIARNGGGGGGGTTNYNALENKPQIAGTTLQGDKSLADLGIASASDVETALGGKVDKVEGKGLSTNDYDNTEKGKVADNASAIEAIIGVNGSCNIYPNTSESGTSSGFVFTKNTDDSISISGTSDGGWGSTATKPFTLKAGTYVLSSGISDNYLAYLWLEDATTHTDIATTANTTGKVEFTLNADTNVIGHVSARANETVNTTVYPMLYDARLNPTGYVPYAMTNRELTENFSNNIKTSRIQGTTQSDGNIGTGIDNGKKILFVVPLIGNIRALPLLDGAMGWWWISVEKFDSNTWSIASSESVDILVFYVDNDYVV